jgi:hypothetical protein
MQRVSQVIKISHTKIKETGGWVEKCLNCMICCKSIRWITAIGYQLNRPGSVLRNNSESEI